MKILLFLGYVSLAAGFTAPASTNHRSNALSAETNTATDKASTTAEINNSLTIPLSYNEMITQTSQAMSDAYNTKGYSRQIVRILLPRDARSGQLGEYYENEAQTERGKSQEMKLVPTDESWQGGIMQVSYWLCLQSFIYQCNSISNHSFIELHHPQQRIFCDNYAPLVLLQESLQRL
jgi:hypothetical protein